MVTPLTSTTTSTTTNESIGNTGPTCTVVVCTRNRPIELDECLAALSRQDYPNCSVLVVDSGPDEPVERVCSRWGAAYILEPIAGLSRARNRGIRACSSEVVAFTDDDAVPDPGWVSALVHEFTDPDVAAVAGRIRFLKKNASGARMSGDEAKSDWATRPYRVFDSNTKNWFAMACFGGIGDGGNMAFRRKVLYGWSGFDERLGRGRPVNGGEEHLAFMTVLNLGYRIIYTPCAVVRHPSPSTPEELRLREIDALRTSTAYMTLLWMEIPAHRNSLARYILGSRLGIKLISWRPRVSTSVLPWWRALWAMLSGPVLYFRTCRNPARDLSTQCKANKFSDAKNQQR